MRQMLAVWGRPSLPTRLLAATQRPPHGKQTHGRPFSVGQTQRGRVQQPHSDDGRRGSTVVDWAKPLLNRHVLRPRVRRQPASRPSRVDLPVELRLENTAAGHIHGSSFSCPLFSSHFPSSLLSFSFVAFLRFLLFSRLRHGEFFRPTVRNAMAVDTLAMATHS